MVNGVLLLRCRHMLPEDAQIGGITGLYENGSNRRAL